MKFPSVCLARALGAALTCLAVFPATAQTAAAPTTEPGLFLWEVVSMTNRAWLFGTIHAGKREWFPLPDPVEKAFAQSQVLVVEADVTDLDAMGKSVSGMAYAPPDELAKHVPPTDYQRFRDQADRLGVSVNTVRHLKPFTAGSVLMFTEWDKQGFSPVFGIDAYLLKKAKLNKKPIVELEGVAAQSALMDSLTEEEHVRAFAGMLKALEEGVIGEQIDGMTKAWQSGDAFLMLELSRRYNEKIPGAREMEEKFIWSRHEAMLAKIEGYLNKSTDRHFIAVGSLHLTGKRGLVEMLRAKGYIVRQK